MPYNLPDGCAVKEYGVAAKRKTMDTIRKSVRNFVRSVKLFGVSGLKFAYHFYLCYFRDLNDGESKKITRIIYHVKGMRHKIFYRPHTSDVPLILNIFVGVKEYDIPVDPAKFDAILDLGANIGLFSILYAYRFPGKKVVAVEPESENFRILQKNVENGQISVFTEKAGMWYRKSDLRVIDHGNNWAFSVEEIDQEDRQVPDAVKGIDIDSLCDKYELKGGLLIKMDIEGSERQIFEHIGEAKWLDRTAVLIMEIHDRPEGELFRLICDTMGERGFKRTERGENIVFIR